MLLRIVSRKCIEPDVLLNRLYAHHSRVLALARTSLRSPPRSSLVIVEVRFCHYAANPGHSPFLNAWHLTGRKPDASVRNKRENVPSSPRRTPRLSWRGEEVPQRQRACAKCSQRRLHLSRDRRNGGSWKREAILEIDTAISVEA